MSVKGIIGILFIVLAIILLLILRWLNGVSRKDDGSGDAKSFQMLHEFPEKAMVEKEITTGMAYIPSNNMADNSDNSTNQLFIENGTATPSPPTDKF